MRCIGPPQDAPLPAPVMQVFWCSPETHTGPPITFDASNRLANHGFAEHHHLYGEHESDATTERVSTPFGQPRPRCLPQHHQSPLWCRRCSSNPTGTPSCLGQRQGSHGGRRRGMMVDIGAFCVTSHPTSPARGCGDGGKHDGGGLVPMQATPGSERRSYFVLCMFPLSGGTISLLRRSIRRLRNSPGKLRWWHRAVYLYLYISYTPVDVRSDRPVLTGGVLVRRHDILTF